MSTEGDDHFADDRSHPSCRCPVHGALNYSNPLKRPVETIWYRYERYFIIASDYEVDWTDPPDVPVKEYIFRYGKPSSPGALVPGQYPVYSLIPGSPTISRSPRWSRSTSLGATSPIASDPKQTF